MGAFESFLQRHERRPFLRLENDDEPVVGGVVYGEQSALGTYI